MNLVEQTKEWLSGNHITVPDDWLQACVEWIQEENQGRSLNLEETNSLVYEQWLLSDLHDLEVQCLPTDITSAAKYELTGTYALQIDSIHDVGLSYYSQQQKIKGTENPNVKVSADEPTYKPWEQKPSRMLMFKLTDGKQVVQGMEYRPISCLNPQTLPGTKMLSAWTSLNIFHQVIIHGRILCRHGVLMLSEANIKHLGGEVDTLVEANSVLNILQSAMEASAELANKNHRQEFQGSEIRSKKPDMKQKHQAVFPVQGRSFDQKHETVRQPTSTQTRMKHEPLSQRHAGSTVSQKNTQNVNSTTVQHDDFDDDDFMDDIDFDDDFEAECIKSTNPVSKGKKVSQKQCKNNIVQSNAMKHKMGMNTIVSTTSCEVTSEQGRGQYNLGGGNRKDDINRYTRPQNSHGELLQSLNKIHNSDCINDEMDFEDDDIDLQAVEEAERRNKQTNLVKTGFCSRINVNSDDKNKKSLGLNCGVSTLEREKPVETLKDLSAANSEICVNTMNVSETNSDTGLSLRLENSKVPYTTMKPVNRSEKSSDHTLKREPVLLQSQSNDVQYLSPKKVQRLKKEQHSALKSEINLDVDSKYPFTYLSNIMAVPIQAEPKYHTVKAYISTLTGKLSSQDNKWTLSCKINDGTMAVDVDLSTQIEMKSYANLRCNEVLVLTEMIGFSPQEAQEMKKRVARDPSVKEILKEGLQQCQQKLIELMCLMELEISAGNPRPLIVATKPATFHDADMLYNRVMLHWNIFEK